MTNKNSATFWDALAKLRKFLSANPNLVEEFRANPSAFLTARGLDVSIVLDETRSTTLSSILSNAGEAERNAILSALYSLSINNSQPKNPDTVSPSLVICDSWGCSEYDPEPGDDWGDNGGGGGGGGGPGLGIVLANINVYINANVAENANALANANAVQLVNVNANANVNVNANVNTNGIASTAPMPATVSNSDLNSKSVVLPGNFSESAVSTKLRALGLTGPRQVALLKRAAISVMSPTGADQNFRVEYKYRGVTFLIDGHTANAVINITSVVDVA